jgi:hypothetical protein
MLPPFLLVPSVKDNPSPNVYYNLASEPVQFLGNWRLRQELVPFTAFPKCPSHELSKKRRVSTFVASELLKSQLSALFHKGIQQPPRTGTFSNNQSQEIGSLSSTLMIPRSGNKSTPTKPEIHLASSFVRKRWKKPPPTPKYNPTMSTWQTEQARQQQEKKAAEAALQQQMEQTRPK